MLGKTPLELARERKLKKIIPLLENATGTPTAPPTREPVTADVPGLWKKLEGVLAKVAPDLRKSLAKPATAKQLAEVAAATGLPLPDDLQAAYRIYNGQKDDAEGLYVPDDPLDGPYSLMPLKEIVNDWKVQKGLVDGGEFRGEEGMPDAGVRSDWWHPGWLPFMSNGGGDYLCLDLAPAEKGTVGQVIQTSHDSPRRPVIARSLAAFLNLLVERWEQQLEE